MSTTPGRGASPRVAFYFDVGSPYAYLCSERMQRLLPEPIEWRPILLGAIFKATGRSSWALGDYRRRQAGMAEIERRVRAYALPPMRWPDPWPTDYLGAMLATTFAFERGQGREFAHRAFGNAFQRGWELSNPERVIETGCEIGLGRGEVETAMQDADVKRALRRATGAALELGVNGVPTIAVGDELFWGDDRLEDAAAHLAAAAAA
jgi:2-hydroxychromene-2-carboxylate isomerase